MVSSLSKNVLGLKFMQRAQKAIQKDPVDVSYEDYEEDDDDGGDDEERTQQRQLGTDQVPKDISLDKAAIQNIKSKRKCIMHPSYQFCEKYKFGRLSFKGMNMDIETIMQNNKDQVDLNLSVGSSVSQKRPAEESWDDIIHD